MPRKLHVLSYVGRLGGGERLGKGSESVRGSKRGRNVYEDRKGGGPCTTTSMGICALDKWLETKRVGILFAILFAISLGKNLSGIKVPRRRFHFHTFRPFPFFALSFEKVHGGISSNLGRPY